LLSPAHRPGHLLGSFGQPGEQPENDVDSFGYSILISFEEHAHLEVLEDGHLRKDAPQLGDDGDSALQHFLRCEIRDLLPTEHHLTEPHLDQSVDGSKHRGLSCSVRSDDAHDLLGVHLEIDTLKNVEVEITGENIANLEEWASGWSAHVPKYASITASFSITSAGVPSASFSP
jgi:hypothetical protein